MASRPLPHKSCSAALGAAAAGLAAWGLHMVGLGPFSAAAPPAAAAGAARSLALLFSVSAPTMVKGSVVSVSAGRAWAKLRSCGAMRTRKRWLA